MHLAWCLVSISDVVYDFGLFEMAVQKLLTTGCAQMIVMEDLVLKIIVALLSFLIYNYLRVR